MIHISALNPSLTGISEWYSPVKPGTGLHPRPGLPEELQSYFPQIDPYWSPVWFPSRKGESVEEAHDRAGGMLEVLHAQIERKFPRQHERILMVSHAATVIALTRELLSDRELPLRVGCCSLTELKRKDGHDGVLGSYEHIKLASGEHLEEGASRDWGFEDIVIKDGKVGGVWSGELVFLRRHDTFAYR